MQFEFIDGNTTIDGTARRRIRSHVALGRNAGRKLARPSRTNAPAGVTRAQTMAALIRTPSRVEQIARRDDDNPDGNNGKDATLLSMADLPRQVGDTLSLVSLPTQQHAGKSKALVGKSTVPRGRPPVLLGHG